MKKFLKIIFFGIVIVVCIFFLALELIFRIKMPSVEGTINCPNLTAPVTVIRDEWGVPHIKASTAKDAFFAYGYTIAQDRLFQMEIQRRLAKGELSEILGEKLLPIDKKFRTYLFRYAAEKMLLNSKKINPRALEILDAFLAGINYYIETGPLPIEFALMGIPKRPFTRIDSLSMLGYMAYSFNDGISTDPLNSILRQKIKNRNVDELFPEYPKKKSTCIIDNQAYFRSNSQAHSLLHRKNEQWGILNDIVGVVCEKIFSARDDFFDSLAHHLDGVFCFEGSNSWVIAPFRSAHGKPIIANDPHIAHSLPGIWYEARIQFGEIDNYGYFLPMYPYPLIAHNEKRGWAITMFENDDLDLYYETFHPKNPALVMYRGKWVPVTVRREKIRVKGKGEVEHIIRITPHGPIVSDFIEGYAGKPVSMWWVFLKEENPLLDITYEMLVAKTWQEFEKAISKLAAPGLNLSWADSNGNIAWWGAGYIPIRPKHVNHKKILDGSSGKDEVLGYVPFSQNPKLINPKSGIIVTANNRPTWKPLGGVRNIPGYWRPYDRASRITEILSTKEKWSIEELKAVQTDTYSIGARETLPVLIPILEKANNLNHHEKEALQVLKSWNLRYDVDSAGAVVFHFLMHHIMKKGVGDELGDHFVSYADIPDHWIFLKNFIHNPSSKYWDDVKTAKRETRDMIIILAMKAAVEDAISRFRTSPTQWKWGEIHRLEYVHPIGLAKPMNLLYNMGPYPIGGEAHIVNRMKTHFGKMDFKITSIPSTRRLIVVGDPDNSYSILPAGNSGNLKSKHYRDQVKMYLAGQYRKLNFSEASLAGKKTKILNLMPSN
ncbi:MAG: penicillin acylase family protein [Spirochaetes bacterium]|nr:penicillin acylase family protein [Spirochaetota bacterium]